MIGVFVGFSRIFLLGILIFKALTARLLYKSLVFKWLNSSVGSHSMAFLSCKSHKDAVLHDGYRARALATCHWVNKTLFMFTP
jgi:hypothetical protein